MRKNEHKRTARLLRTTGRSIPKTESRKHIQYITSFAKMQGWEVKSFERRFSGFLGSRACDGPV